MNKIYFLLTFFFIGYFQSFAQVVNQKKWIDNELSNLTILEDNIPFDSYGCDLSDVLMQTPNNVVLGFIGDNYQRLKMKFTSVSWNKQKVISFSVKGKSQVKNIITNFEGTIEVIRFLRIKEDDHESNIVIAKYKFVEDKTQKYAGVFEGYLLANINCTDGGAEYNNERLGADGFSNNQYIGTWTSNTTKIIKTANWGDYRIPNSNDLDVGAGEFMPNVKYLKFGWQNYFEAYAKDNKTALAEENKKWWIKK